MIKTIANQPWINFDQYLDIEKLNSLKVELCKGFAESWALGHVLPSVAGIGPNWPDGSGKLPTPVGNELVDVMHRTKKDPNALGHKELLELTKEINSYGYMFLKLIGDNLGIGFNLYLRAPTTQDYNDKHLARKTTYTKAAANFRSLFNWVEEQNVFSEIGRVVVFFNDQDQHCLMHRDRSSLNPVDKPDQFLWINLFPERKQFYMFDGDTGEEFPVTSQVAWFDTENWHASNSSPFAAFSIRVDGVFTDAWLEKTKLTDYRLVP
jgi:hypothetical protein